MKPLALMLLLCATGTYHAQTTSIPDSNFETALINLGYDDVLDERVLTSTIERLIEIDISFSDIADLTGIEDFAALEHLNCSENLLTSLDLGNNSQLKFVNLEKNLLTSVALQGNSLLEEIWLSHNQLTEVDTSQNPALQSLLCDGNSITALDFTNNLLLDQLWCDSNNLTSLELSNQPHLDKLYCNNNPQLSFVNIKNGSNQLLEEFEATNIAKNSCIQVDDSAVAANASTFPYDEWSIDSGGVFSEDCNLSIPGSIKERIAIYPNPATNAITIRLDNSNQLLSAQLFSTTGRLLKVETKPRMDLTHLSSGPYILKIRLIDGSSQTIRIIKQ
jgi:hypothetical protein